MMRLENKFFNSCVYFTESDLFFKAEYGKNTNSTIILVNDEINYMEYFTDWATNNGKTSFAFNFINFLAQAWHSKPKCNFNKEDIRNLIRNIKDEKLKFFLYEGCKLTYNCKYSYKYMKDFCNEVLEYFDMNPINEKLVNMELKLMKEGF